METNSNSRRISRYASLILYLLMTVGFTRPSQAAPGDLDSSFGTGGKVYPTLIT